MSGSVCVFVRFIVQFENIDIHTHTPYTTRHSISFSGCMVGSGLLALIALTCG